MFRRALILGCLILGLNVLAHAQGVSISGQAIVNTPTSVSGIPGNSVLQAVPGAQITVCSAIGGGIPCSPLVTIYSNAALTVIAPNPFTADANGNFQFYVTPTTSGYIYSQTSSGTVGQLFVISPVVPPGGGSISGTILSGQIAVGSGVNTISGSPSLLTVNVSQNPQTSDGMQFISSNGNDTNNGFSWGTAKLTIAGACAALTGGNSSCTAGAGTIYATQTSQAFLPAGVNPNITLKIEAPEGEISSGPIPWIDVRAFGARPFRFAANTITATTTATIATVTTTGISDFIQGDGIVIPKAGAVPSLATPAAPIITTIAANGSQVINYKCVPVDALWGEGIASPAGSTTTAPTVFGVAPNAISTISRAANVVTVTTSSSMPFSTGTFHATIAGITGAVTSFNGLYLVTVSNANTLTYSQTGGNESGTVSGLSYVLFGNSFLLTSVQETAGSNQLVLTTDVNHNLQQQSVLGYPTRIYIDGVQFVGDSPIQGHANGVYTIASTTANTITVNTNYVATTTASGVANSFFSLGSVAQMSVTTWAEQVVACPALPTNAVQFLVYANYGAGFVPAGTTPWEQNIFEDYGPAFNANFFTPPPAMNVPATPNVAAQNQVFSAQILSISGSTLTLDRVVPTTVAAVTAYHDNGVAVFNAVTEACASPLGPANKNQNFSPVYFPFVTPQSNGQYLFSAPLDLAPAGGCLEANILDGAPIRADGTITATIAQVKWHRPDDLGSPQTMGIGPTAAMATVIGRANPMFAAPNTWYMSGLNLLSTSSGQNDIVSIGVSPHFDEMAFGTNTGNQGQLTSIPLLLGGQFQAEMHNVELTSDFNFTDPISYGGGRGQVTYWPVPAIEIAPLNGGQGMGAVPTLIVDGKNYGTGRGFLYGQIYPLTLGGSPAYIQISDFWTFQQPGQPLFTLLGTGSAIGTLRMENDQQDSIIVPAVGNIDCINCGNVYMRMVNAGGSQMPRMSGDIWGSVYQFEAFSGEIQNQNASAFNFGRNGFHAWGPLSGSAPVSQLSCEGGTGNAINVLNSIGTVTTSFACPGGQPIAGGTGNITGTGACGTITTITGGSWAGSFKCTGATGASTFTITPGATAPNGWRCNADDETTPADRPSQTSSSTTVCVFTTTSTASNDVIVWGVSAGF